VIEAVSIESASGAGDDYDASEGCLPGDDGVFEDPVTIRPAATSQAAHPHGVPVFRTAVQS
jgi:hypothetical protein